MPARDATNAARHASGDRARERGSALTEFAIALPLLLILVMATIDFGHLVQTRLVITNVSREGGSIVSRELTSAVGPGLLTLLQASGKPLNLGGSDGKIVITRIVAGQNAGSPAPTIAAQVVGGTLAASGGISYGRPNLGLSQNLYDHLTFNSTNGVADIPEISVVEVLFKYRPITPLPRLIPGMLLSAGDGMILSSKAVF
jgi:hypothetical protein